MSQAIGLDRPAIKESATQLLAQFLAGLRFEALPPAVVSRTEEAFLDWFGCALAGRGARPVRILEQFAAAMGPADGPSEILVSRRRTSPFFAALVNGAASHIAEQDDVHIGGLLHPGTVVFPAVFAATQHTGASGKNFIAAAVAGFEAAIRIGEFLGPAHYKVFHTTGTAGTLGAAVGVARLLGLDAAKMQHALGSAGTQAAGLWEFLRDAADSKPLHAAKAAADGLLSAYIARDGFMGASEILQGERGMAAGMGGNAGPAKLSEGLGRRWAITECSYKLHACCRHTHPSADALLALMLEHHLKAEDVARVTAHVHQGAIDVLGAVSYPGTIHQSKFSMGFVLALIALYGRAGIGDFTEAALRDPKIRAFHSRVEMVLDPEIERAAGKRWGGHVTVSTRDGRRLETRIAGPKGDPENTLARAELEDKALRLAAYAGAATPEEMQVIISQAWSLHNAPDLHHFYLGSGKLV
ncbi:MAG: MmgE/PrpD family protein, partial [Candidatus Acidiferrales bacterium]